LASEALRSTRLLQRDIVVVGSSIPDRYQLMNEPPGIVQGFDARTGKRLWLWNAIPQSPSDFGASTWEEGSWRFTGHANVWGPMTVDAARGLLYFGTSTPGNDYYGGRRLGKNEPTEQWALTLPALRQPSPLRHQHPQPRKS
jgi:quinoprotein glucose dehydrogenase